MLDGNQVDPLNNGSPTDKKDSLLNPSADATQRNTENRDEEEADRLMTGQASEEGGATARTTNKKTG